MAEPHFLETTQAARAVAVAWLLIGLATLVGCAAPGSGNDPREPVTASDLTDADRRARARLELASAYFSRGQLETALDEIKLSIQAKPDVAEAFNLRGLIYASMGDVVLAEHSFKRALQLQPRDADTMHNFGWFLCQQRQYDAALAQFQSALAQPQYRGLSRTLAARGLCQARAGHWLEAEGSLMRAYELEPLNPSTSMNLAEVLYQRADFERARFHVARVNSQSETTNAQSLWMAARIEHKLGRFDQSLAFGEQLRARFPQAPETALFEKRRFDD